ncbi:hypothetical protein LSF60_09705 [Rhodococcus pyridinivorans]|nr:hypothetical protein [Rhodococcus pyridinivorans]UGQ59719.1 hypothetical protein LSF60_09705 [Rhodococcus pyridinivorans]
MTRVYRIDEFAGVVVDARLDDHLVVADGDHDRARGFEGADDLLDRYAGDVLQVSGNRQRGEHHGQVRLDGIPGPVEDRSGLEVGLGHPERLLDLPQVVVRRHHGVAIHDRRVDIGDVPLVSGRLASPFDRGLVQSDVLSDELDEPLLLQGLGPVGHSLSTVDLRAERAAIPLGALPLVMPHHSAVAPVAALPHRAGQLHDLAVVDALPRRPKCSSSSLGALEVREPTMNSRPASSSR